jgi:tight adherence protein B
MDYSLTTGSSLRDLLIAQASVRRSQSFASQRLTIERLGVRLMIPLGLVVLPAFVLIGVVPVTVGMLAN